MSRPAVSVIVPFRGDETAAARLRRSLSALRLRPGDELVVADNSDRGAAAAIASERLRVVAARGESSSYHARNAGVAASSGEWVVFTDADCIPAPDLLDAYFERPPPAVAGALAGSVVGEEGQVAFTARYARSRGILDQEAGLHTAGDAAATANLAVRRQVLEELGGFVEGIRSGGDVDLCRRMMAAGWTIERRPGAVVRHLHRESLVDLLGSMARYSSGARWLNERYPGTAPQWPLLAGLAHCARDITGELARLRFESAAFRGVDALGMFAHVAGYRRSNRAN